MRIQVFDEVLHIQVKEDTISKNYEIATKNNSEKWVELPALKEGIYNTRKNKNDDGGLVDGTDFAVFTKDTAFNFDEVPLPYGRVLTGTFHQFKFKRKTTSR